MNIGEASKASGVNQKMIRYYESIGLIDGVGRSANGYRTYTQNDVHTLAFIRRARHLGFSIEQIQALMTLWRDKERSSAEVKAIAQGHIAELEAKIDELASMQRTLQHLKLYHCPLGEAAEAASALRTSVSCEAAMPAPNPSPERRRKRRRSIVGTARVRPRARESTSVRDDDVAPSPVDLRVNSMLPPVGQAIEGNGGAPQGPVRCAPWRSTA